MTVILHALWMLCALGAVVFAAAAARRIGHVGVMTIAYAVASALSGPARPPDPEFAGVLAASGALVYLFRPRHAWIAAMAGGALAGMLAGLLVIMGAPGPVAVPLVAAIAAGTVWLARARPIFAPETLREEGLLIICLLGLGVAVLPSVLDGWQAAANLNVGAEPGATQTIPLWTLTILMLSSLLGAAYSLWSRR